MSAVLVGGAASPSWPATCRPRSEQHSGAPADGSPSGRACQAALPRQFSPGISEAEVEASRLFTQPEIAFGEIVERAAYIRKGVGQGRQHAVDFKAFGQAMIARAAEACAAHAFEILEAGCSVALRA